MTLEQRKLAFIKEFVRLEDEDILSNLETVLTSQIREKNSVKPMSADELRQRAEQSEKDFAEGRFKTSEEILSDYTS